MKDKGSGASTARVTYQSKNPRIMRESLKNFPDEPLRTSDLKPSEEEKTRPTHLQIQTQNFTSKQSQQQFPHSTTHSDLQKKTLFSKPPQLPSHPLNH